MRYHHQSSSIHSIHNPHRSLSIRIAHICTVAHITGTRLEAAIEGDIRSCWVDQHLLCTSSCNRSDHDRSGT